MLARGTGKSRRCRFLNQGDAPLSIGMQMSRFATAFLLVALWAPPSLATGLEDRIIASLETQGYTILERGYTFLGRWRVVVENADYHRELVFNPGTGEILRDYTVRIEVYLANQRNDDRDSSSGNDNPKVLAAEEPTPDATGESAEEPLQEGLVLVPDAILP